MEQHSSDFTKVMREAGYIYPFDWRRRRMNRKVSELEWMRKIHCAEGFFMHTLQDIIN